MTQFIPIIFCVLIGVGIIITTFRFITRSKPSTSNEQIPEPPHPVHRTNTNIQMTVTTNHAPSPPSNLTMEQFNQMFPPKPYHLAVLEMMKAGKLSSITNNGSISLVHQNGSGSGSQNNETTFIRTELNGNHNNFQIGGSSRSINDVNYSNITGNYEQELPRYSAVESNATATNNYGGQRSNILHGSCPLCHKEFLLQSGSENGSSDITDINLKNNNNNNTQNQKVRVLSCNHVFHDNCITSWLTSFHQTECPVCK